MLEKAKLRLKWKQVSGCLGLWGQVRESRAQGERLASQSEGISLYLDCIQIAKFINLNTKISEFYCMIISIRKKRRKQLVWSFSSHKCQSSIQKYNQRPEKHCQKEKGKKEILWSTPVMQGTTWERVNYG